MLIVFMRSLLRSLIPLPLSLSPLSLLPSLPPYLPPLFSPSFPLSLPSPLFLQSATKTQLLSTRFQTLLAARDQVIHQLVDKEDRLKKELQNKSQSEEKLREEKERLLKVREGRRDGGREGGSEEKERLLKVREGGRERVRRS